VLVTHSPPLGVLDRTAWGKRVGCEALGEALARIAPRLHVFGHIHEAYGTRSGPPLSVNACSCDLSYRAVNAPVVVEWSEVGPRVSRDS
jgi:Icc-related predicted phosphoesterase